MSINKTVASIFTKDNVTIYANGRSYSVSRQYADFSKITEALAAGDYDRAVSYADKALTLARLSANKFTVRNGQVYSGGVQVHNVITERIIEFMEASIPFEPLLRLLDNIALNPNPQSVIEGYQFLEHRNLPLTPDGCFLGYKCLRGDYTSKAFGYNTVEVSTDGGKTFQVFRGHIPNRVGSIVRMNREEVDSNRDRHCSSGLHVGSLEYAGETGWYHNEGDRIVIVKVNPKDVVSVPTDENFTKLRVCEYEVIADYVSALTSPLVETSQPEVKPHWHRERDARGHFLPKYAQR